MLRFHLDPIESIEPWNSSTGPSLSWFALTQGWMAWPVGVFDLYRFRAGIGEALGWPAEDSAPLGFEDRVDYQVARPFEDIAFCLPHWTEPVPAEILGRIGGAPGMSTVLDRYEDLMQSGASDDDLDRAEPALNWVSDRCLDSGHLIAGPVVRICREGETARVLCDNRKRVVDGHPIWSAETVDATIEIDEFLSSMRSFGDSLLREMDERVSRIERGFRRTDVEFDPVALREQHRAAAQRWSTAFQARANADWSAVGRALETLGL